MTPLDGAGVGVGNLVAVGSAVGVSVGGMGVWVGGGVTVISGAAALQAALKYEFKIIITVSRAIKWCFMIVLLAIIKFSVNCQSQSNDCQKLPVRTEP